MDRKHKRVALTEILGGDDGEGGMTEVIESIYMMQHHPSTRVYEKALYIASKYFVGQNMTEITSDMCQYLMEEPEPDVVTQTAATFSQRAKRRA